MRASGHLILFNDQYLEKLTKQGNLSQVAKPRVLPKLATAWINRKAEDR